MASRLTTNQEIAGSTPAVVIIFCFQILAYLGALTYVSVFDPQWPRPQVSVLGCEHAFAISFVPLQHKLGCGGVSNHDHRQSQEYGKSEISQTCQPRLDRLALGSFSASDGFRELGTHFLSCPCDAYRVSSF